MQISSPNINISAKDRCDKVIYYNRLGKELLATEPERASSYFSQALTTSLDIQNFELTVESYCLSAKALSELGHHQSAIVQYISALSLAETHQLPKSEILYALYLTYKAIGDFENALVYHEKYQAIAQSSEKQNRFSEDSKAFLSHVVHDIKEPVRIVKSYQSLVAKKLKQAGIEDYDEYIEYIQSATDRISVLTSSFCHYVNIDTSDIQLTSVKLSEVLHVAQYNLNNIPTHKPIHIIHDDLPELHADFKQMTWLLEQLIANAARYNNADTPTVKIHSDSINGYQRVAVQDNGIGIKEKDIITLLDIAHAPKRYNRDPETTGMGLMICQKIIEKHQGNIWIESVPDEGTTVYFTIPLKK